MYLLTGATRCFDFIDDEGVKISLNCEDGDLVAMDGDLSVSAPCDVGALAVGPNQLRGISAVSYIIRFEWSAPHTCSSGTDVTCLSPYPSRVPNFLEYGVLGVDVEAKQSSIPNSGFGLFLLRDYPNGGIVTEYDGPLRFNLKVTGKRVPITLSESSHYRSVPDSDFVIVGISRDRGLFNGRGGASLANHKPKSEANCRFEAIWTKAAERPRFCEDDGCYHNVPRIVLTLVKPGFEGEELFVDYGDETAIRFLNDYAASPPPSAKMSLPFSEQHFYSDRMSEPPPSLDDGSVAPLDVVMLDAVAMTVLDQSNNRMSPMQVLLFKNYENGYF